MMKGWKNEGDMRGKSEKMRKKKNNTNEKQLIS